MKLFISYGHPQAAICRKICEVLKDRGHEVWFDETNIPHGADWRAEIVNGILTSEGVLSMIDRHSVRDPGVCLDEMSIAIGIRGGNIRYVLLEKQAVAEPPASMTTRQWLDMSDWREHEDDQAWFDTKMDVLVKMVESRENQEFAGIIEELRKKLPMCHVSTSKQDSLLRRPFTGRAWVKDRVDMWLDDPNGTKICFLFGDPGIGKSAFAAHYTHYNGRVAAAIFCEYNNTQFNHPKAVIQTLAFLLACRLPDYRIALADALDHAADLGLYNESELFDVLLAQPLSAGTVDGDRETMCILIDGLDESGDRDRNILTEVLTKYADRLPKWLRILALSQRVEIVTGLSGGADTIDLTGGLEENKADVRAYFEDCLSGRFGGDENYTAMIDLLSENSGGIFLYATLMADALAKGKMSIEDTGSVPDGLDSAFYRWFQWFFPDIREYGKKWQMPLACIAASPEPIPEEEIRTVFDWTNTKLKQLKYTLEVLFRKDVNDFKKDTLQLSHRYIAEWLFSDAAGRYQLDREDAFREMGAAFLEIFKDDPEQLTAYEAYYLRDYVDALPHKKNKEQLLNGKLHGIIVEYGDFARTWSRYETAMKYYMLSEELATAESEDGDGLDRLKRYGRSLSREGNILMLLSQYSKALVLYQKDLELTEKIARERGTLDDLRNLSFSYDHMARVIENRTRYDGNLELYKKDVEVYEKSISGEDEGIIFDLSRLYETLNHYEEVLTLYMKSLALKEKIVKERGSLSDLWNLSVVYESIVRIYREQRHYNAALELSKKDLELCKKLAVERRTLDDLRGLSKCYKMLAGIHEDMYHYDDALELYQKAMELSEKVAIKRGTLDDLCSLSNSYNEVAGVHLKQGQDEKAMELYQRALELSEKITTERGTLGDLRNLAIMYCNIAAINKKNHLYDNAMEMYQKALELFEKITANRGSLDDLKDLSLIYRMLMEIYEKRRLYDDALKLCQKDLGLNKEIAVKLGTFDAEWDLCVSEDDMARIQKMKKSVMKKI